jgi:thiol-disulfide isomerase/thioredoxin
MAALDPGHQRMLVNLARNRAGWKILIGTFLRDRVPRTLFGDHKALIERCLSALLLSLALAQSSAANTPGEVPVGGTLREATLLGLNGPSRRLDAFRGRPLIINVWASWCGPCKAEMASLERLAWRGEQFAIIGISTDDYADQAGSLLKNTNATISHFIDQDRQMEIMLGASQLPLTVFVDADGRILKKIYGARQWDGAGELRLIRETFHTKPRSTYSQHRYAAAVASISNSHFSSKMMMLQRRELHPGTIASARVLSSPGDTIIDYVRASRKCEHNAPILHRLPRFNRETSTYLIA